MNRKTLTLTALGAAAVAVPWLLARRRRGEREISASWIVERPPDEVWQRWRRLDELPRYLRHIESVETLDGRRSRWTAVTPDGRRVEWEAEIVAEEPGRRLAWRSLPGSAVRHSGEIEVIPTPGHGLEDGECVLRAAIAIEGGRLPEAKLAPLTRRALAEDLRRFKSLVEAGEVPRTEGQPTGNRRAVDLSNPF